ncbi:LysR family transcriptional regulator [Asaia bogorensis]|uniref:LysR family transcriptional regulator n=1 Tax=Asaia bogorensis TaxID=91915 RepID=UPI000EFD3A3B|nr:LysR family transcriptional regulator [Asaia bogorensis]
MTQRLPDFEALAIFARVVELGSFSAAAQALGLSRPTISKAIARLEQSTGTYVLNRTSRQLALTETGQRVLAHANRILGEGEAAEAELRQAVHHPHGLLRLTAPISFGLNHVAPLLPDFLARYPEIRLAMTYTDAQLDLIGGGFDIAIRIAAHAPSSLRALHLCRIPLFLVAAPDYLARHGTPSHPRELRQHDGLVYLGTQSSAVVRMTRGEENIQVEPPTSRYSSNNAEAFLPVLRAGLGLGIFPEFMIARDMQTGTLVRVLPEWTLPETELCLLTPPGRSHPARVSAFLHQIGGALKLSPWRESA